MSDVHFAHGQVDPSTGLHKFTVSKGRTMQQYKEMAIRDCADPELRSRGVSRRLFVLGATFASYVEATVEANPGASFEDAVREILQINPFSTMADEAPRFLQIMINMLGEEWEHGPRLRAMRIRTGYSF